MSEKKGKSDKIIDRLNSLPFKKDVEDLGGEIYAVGGAVRDELIGIESKDLDLLIRQVSVEDLTNILSKYGTCNIVGESFGVFKFKAFDAEDDIDIAIPRTEKKSGEGHKGFIVDADPNITLKQDMKRRDFTMNALAMDCTGTIIDYFKGQLDIQRKNIRMVDKKAFSEDPLRMLRAVQFSARFDFDIEKSTADEIRLNVKDFGQISKERVLIELEKIVEKGDCFKGLGALSELGLHSKIFETTGIHYNRANINYNKIKTLAEFVFVANNEYYYTASYFKTEMKGDKETTKLIKNLNHIRYAASNYSAGLGRVSVFEAISECPSLIDTEIYTDLKAVLDRYKLAGYPKTLGEVDIDGYELLELGLEGPQIGKVFKAIVKQILFNKINNNKDEILNFIKTKYINP